MRETGQFEEVSTLGIRLKAFVPHPLPPRPALSLSDRHLDLIEKANRAIGRLDGLSNLIPDIRLFLYFYIRKEALLSSQMEGTQSTLSDLLLYEMEEVPGVPIEDVTEVSSYVAALEHGLAQMGNFPICTRLITEVHSVLLAKGRGRDKAPGEVRTSQIWVGSPSPATAAFIPPPPHRVAASLADLERFINDEQERTPTLVKAALAHVQFETIHPFLDGNGRLGRMLITLILCGERALTEPLLYLSLYFKTHRDAYYQWLQRVRLEGDWEGWLEFFLEGVRETADQAVAAARSALELFAQDRGKIGDLGQIANNVLRVHEFLTSHPLVTAARVHKGVDIALPTVYKALDRLKDLGILEEVTGRQRGKIFVYRRYIDLLAQGAEPLPR